MALGRQFGAAPSFAKRKHGAPRFVERQAALAAPGADLVRREEPGDAVGDP
jgi:hypothetical protein